MPFVRILLLIFVLVAALGHLLRDHIATAILAKAVPALTARAAAVGFDCRNLRYARVTVEGIGRLFLHQPACRLRLRAGEPLSRQGDLALSAGRAGVSVGPLLSGRLRFSIEEGTIERLALETDQPTGQRIGEIAVDVVVPVPGARLKALPALLRQEARQLALEGRTNLPLALTAVATVRLEHGSHDLRLRSQPTATGTRLLLEREDVAQLARSYATPLTDAEITLVSTNPVRAPALLRLSKEAESAAGALKAGNPSFPDDAYRHVYWSYLLTLEYGPEFAERMTDAHEEGATYEFGEAQRRMDMQNNAVGRSYALAGVAASELVERVLVDPAVIRSPSDLPRPASEIP